MITATEPTPPLPELLNSIDLMSTQHPFRTRNELGVMMLRHLEKPLKRFWGVQADRHTHG